MVAFISYAASDFIEWRLAIQEKTEEWKSDIDIEPYVEESDFVTSTDKYDLNDLNFDPSTLEKSAKPISYFRSFIEFGVPILFAISTIILVLCNYA